MVDAPEKLWMTAEEQGWPGSFRSFRLSDLEHPEEYPAYVRADLYEKVKRERDELDARLHLITIDRDRSARRAEAAERLAGARVVTDEAADAPRCWWINHGNYGQITQREDEAAFAKSEGKRVIEYCPKPLLSALAEPAGEAEPAACVACEDNPKDENNPCAVCSRTTPPASAIREALVEIANGCSGRVDRDHLSCRIASAALAGAKP